MVTQRRGKRDRLLSKRLQDFLRTFESLACAGQSRQDDSVERLFALHPWSFRGCYFGAKLPIATRHERPRVRAEGAVALGPWFPAESQRFAIRCRRVGSVTTSEQFI